MCSGTFKHPGRWTPGPTHGAAFSTGSPLQIPIDAGRDIISNENNGSAKVEMATNRLLQAHRNNV